MAKTRTVSAKAKVMSTDHVQVMQTWPVQHGPRLGGKSALITGAGSGIGKAIALLFAKEGAAVCIADVDGKAAGRTAAAIAASGGQAVAVRADVSKARDVGRMTRTCVKQFGGMDVLVCAAGVRGPTGALIDAAEADWDRVFSVNAKGMYLCAKHAIPEMRQRGGGAIVNIASVVGLVGSKMLGPYSASKGAAVLMSRTMALNHAKENIRVNCVCPGSTETPMLFGTFARQPTLEDRRVVRDRYVGYHPLGRLGKPREIANAVLFLASDEASFVTGVALPVDGGRTA